jgi:hypothetical protein
LEQTDAVFFGHITAKGKRGEADAECVVLRAVCGKRDGARLDGRALAMIEDGNRGGEPRISCEDPWLR